MADRRSVMLSLATDMLLCCNWSSKSSHNTLLLQLKIDILVCQVAGIAG